MFTDDTVWDNNDAGGGERLQGGYTPGAPESAIDAPDVHFGPVAPDDGAVGVISQTAGSEPQPILKTAPETGAGSGSGIVANAPKPPQEGEATAVPPTPAPETARPVEAGLRASEPILTADAPATDRRFLIGASLVGSAILILALFIIAGRDRKGGD